MSDNIPEWLADAIVSAINGEASSDTKIEYGKFGYVIICGVATRSGKQALLLHKSRGIRHFTLAHGCLIIAASRYSDVDCFSRLESEGLVEKKENRWVATENGTKVLYALHDNKVIEEGLWA